MRRSAPRRTIIRKSREVRGKNISLIVKILLLISFAAFLYFLFAKHYWNPNAKLVVTFGNIDGGVRVVTLDPVAGQINDYLVPGNVEVEVARGLGLWKIEKVWALGIQEKIGGGKLLTETLTRHMSVPTYIYSDSQGYGIVSGNLKSVLKSILLGYDTNLSMGDRISIAAFTVKVKNTKRVEVDLSKTSFLDKKVLSDGDEGYTPAENPPQSLLATFADLDVAAKYPKVALIDGTGKVGLAEDISILLERLGGKVLLIEKKEVGDFNCEVYARDVLLSKRLSLLFGCEKSSTIKRENFDIELVVGKKFSKNY